MDMERYFERIQLTGSLRADIPSLRSIHFHHSTNIPFENLDIQLGRNIDLEPEAIQRKIVENARGGYCFEQNTLFLSVLRQLGFDVVPCEARVRMGRPVITPRTHMMLIVNVAGERYLADVGFGGEGLMYPVSFASAEERQFLWSYRIHQEAGGFVLQTKRPNGWLDLYSFRPEPVEPVDFEVANWYTSTHPRSGFVQTLTAQLPTPEARYILRNRLFTIERGGVEETTTIAGREQLIQILKETFNLPFPLETRFHNPKF